MTGLWRDQNGTFLSSANVWTGTGPQGTYLAVSPGTAPCDDWTSSQMSALARIGQVGRVGDEWTSFTNTTCDQMARLICFQTAP